MGDNHLGQDMACHQCHASLGGIVEEKATQQDIGRLHRRHYRIRAMIEQGAHGGTWRKILIHHRIRAMIEQGAHGGTCRKIKIYYKAYITASVQWSNRAPMGEPGGRLSPRPCKDRIKRPWANLQLD
jgi:hypothetical protein